MLSRYLWGMARLLFPGLWLLTECMRCAKPHLAVRASTPKSIYGLAIRLHMRLFLESTLCGRILKRACPAALA